MEIKPVLWKAADELPPPANLDEATGERNAWADTAAQHCRNEEYWRERALAAEAKQAGTVLDLDQPEGVLSVPSGFTLIPIRFGVQAQVPLLAADADEAEILIAVDRGASWAQYGTRTAELVYNLRTDLGAGSPVIAASAVATPGFAQAEFVVIPSSLVKSLG